MNNVEYKITGTVVIPDGNLGTAAQVADKLQYDIDPCMVDFVNGDSVGIRAILNPNDTAKLMSLGMALDIQVEVLQ